jgi:hypothetical protein
VCVCGGSHARICFVHKRLILPECLWVGQIYYWARNWGNAARDVRGSKALFEGTAPLQLQCFDRGEAITFSAAEDGYFTLPEGANSPLRFDRFQNLHHPSVDAPLWSAHGQNVIIYR